MSKRWIGTCVGLLASVLLGGCTAESTRVALTAQRRADEVQRTVFERQHEALCVLLYRDLRHRLEAAGMELSAGQQAALNETWNDRDLVEFWAVQDERARALRIAGVDAKLLADQSVVDLLIKSIEARVERVQGGLAAQAGAQALPQVEGVQDERGEQ